MSLSGGGLALDMIGAVLLTLGLFRRPLPLFPGWTRSPLEAANDRAYGTTGGALLLMGFLGQLAGAAGFGSRARGSVLFTAAVVFVAGALLAYAMFGATYVIWFRHAVRWAAAQPWSDSYPHETDLRNWQRTHRGLRFWNHELV